MPETDDVPRPVGPFAGWLDRQLREFGPVGLTGVLHDICKSTNGNYFFTLRDRAAPKSPGVRCVLTPNNARRLRVKLHEDAAVGVVGTLEFRGERGDLRVNVTDLGPPEDMKWPDAG